MQGRVSVRGFAYPGNRKTFRCKTGPFATPFQDERDNLICKVLRRKELVPHFKVVGGWVELGDKIRVRVSVTGSPEHCELALLNSICQPVETHVDGFSSF